MRSRASAPSASASDVPSELTRHQLVRRVHRL